MPIVPGPKRTIAVGTIQAAPFTGPYSPATAGPGIAAMLSTALSESGRFIIVERAGLEQVITEQELGKSGVAQGTQAALPGRVTPAQYLVVGTLTEFSIGDQGSAIGIGAGSGGALGGLAISGRSGRIALDLRVVNTRSTQVEIAFSVKKAIASAGVGVTAGYGGIALGGSHFWNTPLGEATRDALNEAVARIASALSRGAWEALVAEVDGVTVYVNAGGDAGLRVGDRLVITHLGRTLTDPATGQVLATARTRVGTLAITAVEPRYATGTFTQEGSERPKRGDLVIVAE